MLRSACSMSAICAYAKWTKRASTCRFSLTAPPAKAEVTGSPNIITLAEQLALLVRRGSSTVAASGQFLDRLSHVCRPSLLESNPDVLIVQTSEVRVGHDAVSSRASRRHPKSCHCVSPRHRARRLSARIGLGDNPRLLLGCPPPSPPGAREHFQPANQHRLKQKLSVRHVSNRSIEAVRQSRVRRSRGRWGQTPFIAFW